MKITVSVVYEDGTKATTECGPGEFIRFERQFDQSVFNLGQDARLEHFLFLAWIGLSRKGQTGLEFDAWCDTVAEIVPDFGETDADPLGQGVTPTS